VKYKKKGNSACSVYSCKQFLFSFQEIHSLLLLQTSSAYFTFLTLEFFTWYQSIIAENSSFLFFLSSLFKTLLYQSTEKIQVLFFIIFLIPSQTSKCLIILKEMLLQHTMIHSTPPLWIYLMILPTATTCTLLITLVHFWFLKSSPVKITLHRVDP